MNLKKNHYSRRALALLLTLVMCVGMIPTAFAAQQNSYHDPAEHWMQASGRTNELDANSVVTRETFKCGECGKATSFEVFRVPEYDRYLCMECGKIEKRDYVDSLGHAWQGIVIRDATCETDGKLLELCSRCGQMKQTATPKGEHSYEVYTVAATCTSPGYTVRECSVCGDRHIEDITAALPHNYESHVIAATCENGGKTIHRCDGCGSSFVTDYTDALGHSWDEGTLVTNATCTGKGVMEYRCTRCGYHRIEGNEAAGHVPGNDATCTQPQICTKCGAMLKNALGHDYKSKVTAPTCTEMGYTTNTCARCGDTTKTDYTEPAGHKLGDWIIDKEPTTDSEGSKHKECTVCGEKLEASPLRKSTTAPPRTARVRPLWAATL